MPRRNAEVEEREREERKGLHWVQPQNAPTPPTAKVSERERGDKERERGMSLLLRLLFALLLLRLFFAPP